MKFDLSLVPMEDLLRALGSRCAAYAMILAISDEDGLTPEYSVSMKGAPHEIIGLVQVLDMKVRDEVYEVIADPDEAEECED